MECREEGWEDEVLGSGQQRRKADTQGSPPRGDPSDMGAVKSAGAMHISAIIKGAKIEKAAHVWLEGGRGCPTLLQAPAVLNQNYHFDTGKLL